MFTRDSKNNSWTPSLSCPKTASLKPLNNHDLPAAPLRYDALRAVERLKRVLLQAHQHVAQVSPPRALEGGGRFEAVLDFCEGDVPIDVAADGRGRGRHVVKRRPEVCSLLVPGASAVLGPLVVPEVVVV